MPSITDPPPPEVAAELAELRLQLDNDIPRKILDHNVLIATWNLRAFGDLTEKWRAEPGDTPKRDLHALRCIAEIVSRFDVIALQEVRGNLKCLRHMLKALGGNWGLILTDVTKGKSGNYERMAFLFDQRKVNISGLACELVVPPEQLENIKPAALRRQFARTPYAVSFRSCSKTFILVTLHVIYGKNEEERLPDRSAELGAWLLYELRRLRHPHIKEIRGRGLLVGIELLVPARPYCERLMQLGLLCKETHDYVIRLAPPLIIAEKDLAWAAAQLRKAFER